MWSTQSDESQGKREVVCAIGRTLVTKIGVTVEMLKVLPSRALNVRCRTFRRVSAQRAAQPWSAYARNLRPCVALSCCFTATSVTPALAPHRCTLEVLRESLEGDRGDHFMPQAVGVPQGVACKARLAHALGAGRCAKRILVARTVEVPAQRCREARRKSASGRAQIQQAVRRRGGSDGSEAPNSTP